MTSSKVINDHQLYKTTTRLADGRSLIYFDETDRGPRVARDLRDLPTVIGGSQMRYDVLRDEWVGIAGHRQDRTYHPPADACPLCPTTDRNPSEIPSADYDVVVFENRFPSFSGVGEIAVQGSLFEKHPGLGRCEVVCFTSNHNATLPSLPPTRVRSVIEVWTDRTRALSERPGVKQIFCFENRGVEIGVTLAHPHGQIYGYPYITPRTAGEIASAQKYRHRTGRNLFADLITGEIGEAERVVDQNEHWVAFVPFAARWPMEVHLYPLEQTRDLTELSDEQKASLAQLYRSTVKRMESVFDDTLPAITAVHQTPVHTDNDDYWLHLEVFSIRRAPGKIKYLAGSEAAMGAFVSDVSPELVAERLRSVNVH